MILNEPDEIEESTAVEPTPEPTAEPTEVEAPVAEAVAEPVGEATEPAPDVTLPEGYKLDALGRVHGPDGRVVSKEEAEKIKAQAVPAEPAALVEAPVAPVTPDPVPVTPAAEPFTFRANGQKHAIEGLTVAPEKAELVRSLLVDGMNHRQNFPRMQAEWKQRLAQAEQMVEAKSGKYNKASVVLWDKLSQLLADQPQELEMTRREVALMLKEADMAIPQQPTAQPEVDEAQMEQAARATLTGYVEELFEDTPSAKQFFTDEDKKDFAAAVQHRLNAYFVEHQGEIVLDTEAVKKDFEREIRLAQRAHQARETAARDAQKAKQAAAFNAAQVAKPTATATPTKPKPTPARAAAPSGQKPGWDQSFKSAWEDEAEDE